MCMTASWFGSHRDPPNTSLPELSRFGRWRAHLGLCHRVRTGSRASKLAAGLATVKDKPLRGGPSAPSLTDTARGSQRRTWSRRGDGRQPVEPGDEQLIKKQAWQLRPNVCRASAVARRALGQRDIGGVIGRQIVPQIPNTRQKEIVRVSPQRVRQVGESHAAALAVDFPVRGEAPDHLCDLHIKQMRRMERLTRGEQPILHDFRRRRAEKGFKQGGSVDDDHARSRSARTASAGGTEGAVSVRLRKRARNSSIVGRSAT